MGSGSGPNSDIASCCQCHHFPHIGQLEIGLQNQENKTMGEMTRPVDLVRTGDERKKKNPRTKKKKKKKKTSTN